MTKDKLDKIHAKIVKSNEKHRLDRVAIFKANGVTASEFYDEFWKQFSGGDYVGRDSQVR